MKRWARSFIFIVICTAALAFLSSCSRPVYDPSSADPWNGAKTKTVCVDDNYSAYGYRSKDWNMCLSPEFYIDPERNTMIPARWENDKWSLDIPEDIYDIYIELPVISLIEEIEQQTIILDGHFPIETDAFTIVDAYIPQLFDRNLQTGAVPETDFSIRLCCISKSNQYPTWLNLSSDHLKPRTTNRGRSWEATGRMPDYVQYQYEMPDLYTAAMVLKNGELSYQKLENYIIATEVTFSCDDASITLNILE